MKTKTINAFLTLFLFALSAHARDVRFATLTPAGDGTWHAVVDGAKPNAELAFWADGERLTAERDGDGFRLSGVPAAARTLAVGTAGKKEATPTAAVRVAPSTPAERPFDDWVIYQIMMGYFRDGNPANDGEISGWRHPNYAGGDLQGVLEEGAYLAELGVDAVWLSPIFASQTSHGYDVTNYYRLADAVAVPGDAEASTALFRRLVEDFHGRGLRIVLDLPLNHASRAYDFETGDPGGLHPRATAARQEAEKLWESWGAPYRYWNFDAAATRQFLTGVALHWLVDEQVDGLRLDYVRGVPHDYWAELYAAVKEKKPSAFLLGECWMDADGIDANAREIARYAELLDGRRQFDSLVDFPMQIALVDVFAKSGSAEELEATLQTTAALYPPETEPAYFFDNHDLARFMSWTDDRARLSAALTFMSALSSPIVIFYGTETGLAHGAPKPGFTDAGRLPMPWDSLDPELGAEVRELLQLRKDHPALARGGRLPLHVDDDTLVMAKITPEEVVWVGVNLSSQAKTVELPASAGAFEALIGASVPLAAGEGSLRWDLTPRRTLIARLKTGGGPAP